MSETVAATNGGAGGKTTACMDSMLSEWHRGGADGSRSTWGVRESGGIVGFGNGSGEVEVFSWSSLLVL